MRLIYLTIRFEVSAEDKKNLSVKPPAALIIWHNRIAITPYIKTTFRKKFKIYAMISKSKDGSILEYFFKNFDINCDRGSDNDGGAKAAVALIRRLRSGFDICVTPDGPRGPKYEMKKGILSICQKTNASILFMRGKIGAHWKFKKSWDDFMLPKPFSKVVIKATTFPNYEALEAAAAQKNMSTYDYAQSLLNYEDWD